MTTASVTVPREALTTVLRWTRQPNCPPAVAQDAATLTAIVIEAAGHVVTFHEGGTWSMDHSSLCNRAAGDCEYQAAVRRVIGRGAPLEGRWRVTGLCDGLPELERVDDGDG